MKIVTLLLAMFAMGSIMLIQSGCQTDQPGATDTMGVYTTNVDSTPDKVTTAAYKACEDLQFNNINSSGSKVDGKVTAKTAQNEDVSIDISQSGDSVSKVSVHVGATGDTAVSKQVVDRINSHLSWF